MSTVTELQTKVAAATLLMSPPAHAPAPRPTGFASIATGGDYKGIPHFTDLLKKREWQLEHMAAAMRNFARNGYTDGIAGHLSVRDPIDPDTFWINPYVFFFELFDTILLAD